MPCEYIYIVFEIITTTYAAQLSRPSFSRQHPLTDGLRKLRQQGACYLLLLYTIGTCTNLKLVLTIASRTPMTHQETKNIVRVEHLTTSIEALVFPKGNPAQSIG
jgi:hypothetical protein